MIAVGGRPMAPVKVKVLVSHCLPQQGAWPAQRGLIGLRKHNLSIRLTTPQVINEHGPKSAGLVVAPDTGRWVWVWV